MLTTATHIVRGTCPGSPARSSAASVRRTTRVVGRVAPRATEGGGGGGGSTTVAAPTKTTNTSNKAAQTMAGEKKVQAERPFASAPRKAEPLFGKLARTNAGEDYAKTLVGFTDDDAAYFDPLKLARSVSPGEVKRWREAEITHGRVAMYASVGYLVGELPAVEANPIFNGSVSGPALRQFQQVDSQSGSFWLLLLGVIGISEFYRSLYGWRSPIGTGKAEGGVLKDDYTPGDIGFDPLNFKSSYCATPENLRLMQLKELNNGRLAMIAIAGMVAQEEVDGMKIFDHISAFGFAPAHGITVM